MTIYRLTPNFVADIADPLVEINSFMFDEENKRVTINIKLTNEGVSVKMFTLPPAEYIGNWQDVNINSVMLNQLAQYEI